MQPAAYPAISSSPKVVRSPWWVGLLFVAGCLVPGQLAGYLGTLLPGQGWFATLAKPALFPTSVAFFVGVWVVNYTVMGLAAWRVWDQRAVAPQRVRTALRWFTGQLVVGFAWVPLVNFSQRVEMAVFLDVFDGALAFLTAGYFYRVSRPAFYWLLPYLAWLCFTTWLKIGVLRLN